MKRLLAGLILLMAILACSKNQTFTTVTEKDYKSPEVLSLFVFISPECPLCENYSKDFNALRDLYPNDSLKIYGVFSGKELYSEKRIAKFRNQYNLKIDFVMDEDYRLAKYFKAEVTPECFLVKPKGEIVYSGKYDNWLEKLGRRRKMVSRHYVKDAIECVINNTPIPVKKTQAIGCLMQY